MKSFLEQLCDDVFLGLHCDKGLPYRPRGNVPRVQGRDHPTFGLHYCLPSTTI